MQLLEHGSMTDMRGWFSGDASLGMGICDVRALLTHMLLAEWKKLAMTAQRLCSAFVPSTLSECASALKLQKAQHLLLVHEDTQMVQMQGSIAFAIHQANMCLALVMVCTVLTNSLYEVLS